MLELKPVKDFSNFDVNLFKFDGNIISEESSLEAHVR